MTVLISSNLSSEIHEYRPLSSCHALHDDLIFDPRGTHQRATHHLCSFSAQKRFELLGIISNVCELFGLNLELF